jgi:hypothetical protein
MNKIIKALAVGGLVYLAYKLGQNSAKKEVSNEQKKNVFVESDSEKELVSSILKDLKNKPNKTPQDKINIGLLEVKLKQL